MHKPSQLLALAAVAALLVAAVVADVRSSGEDAPGSRRLVPGYAAAGGVARITWERPGEDAVVLERADAGAFVLSSHPGAVVDPHAVSDVLGTLELLSYVRRGRGAGRDLAAERGLQPPRVRLRVLLADGRERVIALGDRIPAIDRVWARVWTARRTPSGQAEGVSLEGVYLIEGYAARALDRRADELRVRRAFALPAEHIDAVEVRAGERVLVISGRPPRVEVTAGRGVTGTVLADPAAVAGLIEELRELAIARFVPGAAGRGAAPADALSIHVRGRDRRLELTVRGPCAGSPGMRRVATSVGTGCMAAEPLDALRARAGDPTAMLARAPLAGEPASELTLTAPGEPAVHLRARGRAWSLAGGDRALAVESAAVDRWLSDLARSSAGRYVPRGEAAAPGELALAIAVTYRSGGQQRIAVFARGARSFTACRDREPLCLVLDLQPFASRILPIFADRFRRRQLLSLEPYALRRAVLERRGKLAAHLLRGALLDDWQVRVPAGRSPAGRVVDTLRELGRLRARAFVARAPEPAHGLTPPRARIEVTFDPGPLESSPQRHVLDVGARTPTGCTARLDRAGPVFEIAESMCDVLLGEWTRSAAPAPGLD